MLRVFISPGEAARTSPQQPNIVNRCIANVYPLFATYSKCNTIRIILAFWCLHSYFWLVVF